MKRGLWLVIALGACSRLFSLDGAAPDDRDGDRVPDLLDNCPDKANSDQSDIDADGVGDACQGCQSPSGADDDLDGIPNECDGCDNRMPDGNHDGIPDACETLNDAGTIVLGPVDASTCPTCQTCLLGPSHDEDGDTFADACDPCPAFPDANAGSVMSENLSDTDSDGVSDRCDTLSTARSRQIFDSFAAPNQSWFDNGGAWVVIHDELRITPGPQAFTRYLGTGSSDFVARASVSVTGGILASAQAGVSLSHNLTPNGGTDVTLTCMVEAGATNGGTLVYTETSKSPTTSSVPLLEDPPYVVALEYTADAVVCSIVGGARIRVTNTNVNGDLWIAGVVANGSSQAAFQWYQFATDY